MSKFVLVWFLALSALSAHAQDTEDLELDRITVTGSRINYADLLDTPAVSVTKPGDYLLQPIVLTNDSRDAAMRK
jgi:hypothetical protein